SRLSIRRTSLVQAVDRFDLCRARRQCRPADVHESARVLPRLDSRKDDLTESREEPVAVRHYSDHFLDAQMGSGRQDADASYLWHLLHDRLTDNEPPEASVHVVEADVISRHEALADDPALLDLPCVRDVLRARATEGLAKQDQEHNRPDARGRHRCTLTFASPAAAAARPPPKRGRGSSARSTSCGR